jgi:hypothetical protein
MADTAIPIQPAAPAVPAQVPVLIKTFQQVDEFGNVSQAQAVMLVDDLGRFQQGLTEKTGRQILMAVRDLHNALILAQGGMLPSVNETLTEE